MKKLSTAPNKLPKFTSEDTEADWWASTEGRAFLKQNASGKAMEKSKSAMLVASLNSKSSVQIALRLPAPDVKIAREIAGRKGIGYQTLLKMLVHEGLRREARRT